MTIKQQVQQCLERYPQTRDDDKILIPAVWALFHAEHIKRVDNEQYVKLKDIVLLPTPESITRVRRKFQEEGQYLASAMAQQKRGEREAHFREEMRKPAAEVEV